MARKNREKYAHIWPIDEKAGKPPEWWPGWPEGKKFALVLTHDVESAKGISRCLQLADLEEKLGFRSSFNFVAEDYEIPEGLIENLKSRGFEIGLHGLTHNGNPFRSKRYFRKNIARINHYLNKWEAKGFRAPSMYHDLNLVGELDIEYDSSTFDTDPFEPQPDGVGTIFPFLVPRNSLNTYNRKSQGVSAQGVDQRNHKDQTDQPLNPQHCSTAALSNYYVELPYTLPQDHLLFIILKEKDISIWKRKLDWIAEKGGMAFLITHPDYMTFNGRKLVINEYPVEYYREYLEYIKHNYKDQYWTSLPRDLACFWKQKVAHLSISLSSENVTYLPTDLNRVVSRDMRPPEVRPSKNKRKHVLLIVENQSAPHDRRVWAEARWAKRMGLDVTVICPTNEGARARKEWLKGIQILRYPKVDGTFRKFGIAFEYLHALFWQTLLSCYLYLKNPFHLVHAANPPDNIFLVANLFRILGTKFVYDLHDLSPELFLTKYSGKKSFLYRVLILLEKFSLRTAHVVITVNDSYKKIIADRHGISREKIFVVRNDPDMDEFEELGRKEKSGNKKPIELLFVGCINSQDGVDLLMEVLACLINDFGERGFICTIIGGGDYLAKVKERARQLSLLSFVIFKGIIWDRKKVLNHIWEADICLEPAPENELNRHSTFIKVMEYMAAGKPLVAFDLPETRFSTDGAAFLVPPGDKIAFAQALKRLIGDADLRRKMGVVGLERVAKELNWKNSVLNLEKAYRSLGIFIPQEINVH